MNDTSEENSTTRWRVGRVYRSNAGGSLYAPVDQNGEEYGVTPSYDGAAVQRFVDYLNGPGRTYDLTALGRGIVQRWQS